MDTPPSPPTQQPTTTSPPSNHLPPQPQPPTSIPLTSPSTSIPLTSPLRTHPKRLLPPTLASTYPHGHISGHPRPPTAQRAFDARRTEILRTMSREEIEAQYESVAGRVREVLAEREERGREVEGEVEKLRGEREIERRVWERVMGGVRG